MTSWRDCVAGNEHEDQFRGGPAVYEILLSTHAQRDLRRLPGEVVQRILAAIRAMSQNPRPPRCRKLTGMDDDYRLRVGDYRVIYSVDDAARRVHVMYVRHRREAYR